MLYSDNGWPVLDNEDTDSRVTLHIGGAAFSVLKEAEPEFRALLTMLNKIDPFAQYGYDGGFYRRPIAGSSVWSTHASATGVDINAAKHPQFQRNAGWTLAQRAYIYAWLKVGVGRCFTWGNDFKSRPDPMHFQLKDRATWLKYRASAMQAAVQHNKITGVQLAIGAHPDGILGPLTQAKFVEVRRMCQINRLRHPDRIAAVQRAVRIHVRRSPIWGRKTDAALKALGFDTSRVNKP